MNNIYFQWQGNNYGAFYKDSIILLRAELNDYAGLEEEASLYLKIILSKAFAKIDSKFFLNDNQIDGCKLNNYINYFINQNIIEESSCFERNNFLGEPIEAIGLKDKSWYSETKNVRTTILLVIKALFILHKIHHIIKNYQVQGIINYLHRLTSRSSKNYKIASELVSLKFAKALDDACLFYPQKTLCLPFAAALACLHYNQGYDCSFIIGVQNIPFYAHAWVESNEKVINDNPELKIKLAPILKITSNLKLF